MLAHILAVASLLALSAAHDYPEIDQYTSNDCSGDPTSIDIPDDQAKADITLDTTSQSLYLANATWTGFSDYSAEDECAGDSIDVDTGCIDLTQSLTPSGSSILCVRMTPLSE
ncbi:hypothetical protein VM1G_02263 [Cytospora mali]|uniref:Uncharacterized protein n=1 Tax=Cytospora mali TaxID=578113 RepID=A0A194VS81_CYTMA|nr:hypothetical protein VM1G_02263 [Valsa mali]